MHDLDITNDVASFASANVPAWHRLGTVLDHVMTPTEAMEAAHLAGWNVRKLEMTAAEISEDGVTLLDVEQHRATVRTNPITGATEVLGVVGKDYGVVQNEEQAAFLGALIDESGAFIETAGALRGGRQTFVTAKLPLAMLVGGVDRVDLYVALLSSHDGSMSFKGLVTPTRIVCANTQAAAIRNASQSWSRRHTSGVKAAVAEARASLTLTWRFAEAFEAEAERMIQTSITDAEFEAIMTRVFEAPAASDSPLQERRKIERLDIIRGLYHDAATQDGIRGTHWGAYQAIGEYVDHRAPARGADDAAKAASRALGAIDGPGVTRKNRAFELLRVSA